MTKTPAQLDQEIARTILPPGIIKKWKAKVTAYKRAISKLETSYNDDLFKAAVHARDALYKTINDAAAYVPYVPGQSPYTSEAIQVLEREREQLVSSSTLAQAAEHGREVNYQRGREQIAKLKEEEREVQRPLAWMRGSQHAKIAKDLPWGPVKTSEQPPVGGTTMSIDGRTFSILPAAIRTVRGHYERSLARLAKRNQDDAWLVISPNGSVLALITGLGRHWSIYRRDDGQPWRKDEEAEITYRRGVEDDWRTVVQGIVKMTI